MHISWYSRPSPPTTHPLWPLPGPARTWTRPKRLRVVVALRIPSYKRVGFAELGSGWVDCMFFDSRGFV